MKKGLPPEQIEKRERLIKLIELWKKANRAGLNLIPDIKEMLEVYPELTHLTKSFSPSEESQVDEQGRLDS